jgi:UDP-N-acetylmuramoyl-tripeptide--D-alanyl-D-alanine ligase
MGAMMAMRLSEAAQVLSAQHTGADVAFRGLSTDSRRPMPGALFFALQGPNFDGHTYVDAARAQGAVAAAVSRPCTSPLPQIRVSDTRLALGQLSANWRNRFEIPVIAITGSNGKTTVRAMTAAILARCGNTLSTRGNLNNDIGLPLTLARLASEDDYAVIEMGANHPGEIAYLTGIARPTIGVVTNAGPAHLEGFGDLSGVARAKGELFAGLAADGVAVINAEDEFAPLWRGLAAHCRTVEFGLHAGVDVSAQWHGDAGGSDIELTTPAGSLALRLPLPGRHNVMNALAAATVAQLAGAGLDDIRLGLEALVPVAGRFNVHRLPGDIMLIDDTYNANPGSLQAALDVLSQADCDTWLVLGDMGELGAGATELHRRAGEQARAAGVTCLYGLGDLARAAVEAFAGPGAAFDSPERLLDGLREKLRGPLYILVKGSRRMRMERVVEGLLGTLQPDATPSRENH